MGMNEKRRFHRATVAFPVAVSVPCGSKVTAQAIDISVDGIGIRSDEALLTDTSFAIQLPFEWGPTFVIAKIVRREGSIYGCQFKDLTPKEYNALEALVNQSWQQKLFKTTALSYRVGTFKNISLFNIFVTLLLAGIPLAAATVGPLKPYLWPLAAISAIFLVMGLFFFSQTDETGWQLSDDSLYIQGGQYSETINLSTLRAALVDLKSEWEPRFRKTEYGIEGLSNGSITELCHLKNNQEAIVFRHEESPRALLLRAKFRYFLIIHPGVEELYEELIKRGIQQIVK